MEYYNCLKLVKIPLKDVVLRIYEFFNDKKADFISLSELYEFLREEFNVKSFNRANLVELLNADSTVDFNIVKDLYIKYVLSYDETESTDAEVLDRVFLERKEYLIETIKVLGLDVIKDILLNGSEKYYNFLGCLVENDNRLDFVVDDDAKLLYSFVEKFDEERLLELLQENEILTQEIFMFKSERIKEHKIQAFNGAIVSFFQLDDQALGKASMKQTGVEEGSLVYSLGFPVSLANDLVDSINKAPVCRLGCVSRIEHLYHNNNAKFYIIDAPVYPGNSGGPIINRPEMISIQGTPVNSTANLIGIVSAYIPYRENLMSTQTGRIRMVNEENSGLTVVFPVDDIKEVVELERTRSTGLQSGQKMDGLN